MNRPILCKPVEPSVHLVQSQYQIGGWSTIGPVQSNSKNIDTYTYWSLNRPWQYPETPDSLIQLSHHWMRSLCHNFIITTWQLNPYCLRVLQILGDSFSIQILGVNLKVEVVVTKVEDNVLIPSTSTSTLMIVLPITWPIITHYLYWSTTDPLHC